MERDRGRRTRIFGTGESRTNALTHRRKSRTISLPMTRILIAESLLQGMSLSSFGADAYQSGQTLEHEPKPERRKAANTGSPVVCR